jgi:hypothetical protein
MKISEEESIVLKEDFSKEEVWLALFNCDGNKTPGPNDFSVNILKAHWQDIKEDFMNFMHEFHNGGLSVQDINKAFIAFIPKWANRNNEGF